MIRRLAAAIRARGRRLLNRVRWLRPTKWLNDLWNEYADHPDYDDTWIPR